MDFGALLADPEAERPEEPSVDEQDDIPEDEVAAVVGDKDATDGQGAASPAWGAVPWPKVWSDFASDVRSQGIVAFLEIFAGEAILTQAFRELGWSTGTPIDVGTCSDFSPLNPLFLVMLVGCIREGGSPMFFLQRDPCCGPENSCEIMAMAPRISMADREAG